MEFLGGYSIRIVRDAERHSSVNEAKTACPQLNAL